MLPTKRTPTKLARKTVTKAAIFAVAISLFLSSLTSGICTRHPYLSSLHATKDSPLYTTYAAATERSEFAPDVAYHLVFYDSSRGIVFRNQKGGDWSIAFTEPKLGAPAEFVCKLGDLHSQPVITTSYSDVVCYHYYPFADVRIDSRFLVYSSRLALQEVSISNLAGKEREIEAVPFLSIDNGKYHNVRIAADGKSVSFRYYDRPDGWMVEHKTPHLDTVDNVFSWNVAADSFASSPEALPWSCRAVPSDSVRSIGLFRTFRIPPHGRVTFTVSRAIGGIATGDVALLESARSAFRLDMRTFISADEKAYGRIPDLRFVSQDLKMMYWSAFSLMRQCMLPAEGKCHYNYYVFSREPVWGWGHGGEVFHESLSMLAYVFMDPRGAMNSQRVYMERQHPDGYINYRTGPYLDETIPYNGEPTTSAPWFSWENWEIYRVTRDRVFLREAYDSGAKLFRYWESHRSSKHDGLFEWGGQAILESVRDDQVAVWDKVGWPANFEGPDLNSMLVMEAGALSNMAKVLGEKRQSNMWERKADAISKLINKYMWDDSSGFYYNVNRNDHSFTFSKPNDLKRREIIGFLPLWSGIATRAQAAILVKAMTDTAEFWRPYGVPSLAADDPYYNPHGYWNGPVWVQWEYLLERGLMRYGYGVIARRLVDRVASGVVAQLKKDHNFWEFYSPDSQWAGYHRTYIWGGLVSRMMIDVNNSRK